MLKQPKNTMPGMVRLEPIRGRIEELRERCIAADEKEASGDPHQRSQPFQARRRKQIKLLQEGWEIIFPEQPYLLRANAKAFLSQPHADNSAEEVLDVMELVCALEVEWPIGYIFTALRNGPTWLQQEDARSEDGRASQGQ